MTDDIHKFSSKNQLSLLSKKCRTTEPGTDPIYRHQSITACAYAYAYIREGLTVQSKSGYSRIGRATSVWSSLLDGTAMTYVVVDVRQALRISGEGCDPKLAASV